MSGKAAVRCSRVLTLNFDVMRTLFELEKMVTSQKPSTWALIRVRASFCSAKNEGPGPFSLAETSSIEGQPEIPFRQLSDT